MKYVVAVDSSGLSFEAAKFACGLAKPGKFSLFFSSFLFGCFSVGDSVFLLHVVEKQSMDGLVDEEGSSITMAAVMDSVNKKAEERGQELVDTKVGELQKLFPKLGIAGKVVSGFDARAEIVRVLDEDLEADVLVTGSRGIGTMERILLGSVSDYLTKNATVPVLVYRPPK